MDVQRIKHGAFGGLAGGRLNVIRTAVLFGLAYGAVWFLGAVYGLLHVRYFRRRVAARGTSRLTAASAGPWVLSSSPGPWVRSSGLSFRSLEIADLKRDAWRYTHAGRLIARMERKCLKEN